MSDKKKDSKKRKLSDLKDAPTEETVRQVIEVLKEYPVYKPVVSDDVKGVTEIRSTNAFSQLAQGIRHNYAQNYPESANKALLEKGNEDKLVVAALSMFISNTSHTIFF